MRSIAGVGMTGREPRTTKKADELLEPLPAPAYLWDIATECFIGSNQPFRDLLGYSRDEVLDLHWRDLLVPDEIPVAERAIAIGPVMDAVCWHWRKKDGAVIAVTLAARRTAFITDNGDARDVMVALVIGRGQSVIPAVEAF
jgi:PAS domain S-box-containing protein